MNRKNPRDIDEAELAKADATFYGIPALLGLESEFRNKDGRLEFESVELYGDGNGVRVELRRDSRKHPSEFEFEALSIEEHFRLDSGGERIVLQKQELVYELR